MNKNVIDNRVAKMLGLRKIYEADIENTHLKLQKGNSKTGKKCYTVSLIPIADCRNCSHCSGDCYDIRNVCFQPAVQNDRARNSAIHHLDRKRYWEEIEAQIRANSVTQLRINVGGDLDFEDFEYLLMLGERNPNTDVLFFTKNYRDCNEYIKIYIKRYPDNYGFPRNIHPIYSNWPGMEMSNPYNVPESHVLWNDGSTTAPEYGAYYCGGNCSECHLNGEGCWTLRSGEHVIFKAH